MTGIIEVHFPEDQQDGTEATITQWLVAEGDVVKAHDAIVEIETDKVVVEVAAPENGRVMNIKIRQDEEVNPGDVLCTLMSGEDLEAGESLPKEPASVADKQDVIKEQNRLSPAVRQRVLEHNIDISRVQGSGRDGRITLHDVENLVADGNEAGHDSDAPADITRLFPEKPDNASPSDKTSDIIPHDKMRKRIADSMVTSLLHTAPHVTAVFEADLSAVMRHRKSP